MNKKLTQKLKRVYFPIIKKRDGDICFFCLLMFVIEVTKWNRTYHHLNKNTEDNRPENLVFAHEECNRLCEDKPDWQILSKEKLLDNEKYHHYHQQSLLLSLLYSPFSTLLLVFFKVCYRCTF